MNIHYADKDTFQNSRDPFTAVVLSFCPGLGQLYVGDRRKGILFLNVAFVNLMLLALCLYANQLYENVSQFAGMYHMRLNQDAVGSLHGLKLGSPASWMLMLLAGAFVLFCARDAYDRASHFGSRKTPIYKDAVIGLPETGSFSYLSHFALMATFAVMAMFFITAPKKSVEKVQEFIIMDTVPVKQQRHAKFVSDKTSEEHGKVTAKSCTPQQQAATSQLQTAPAEPQQEVTRSPAKSEPTPKQIVSKPAPPAPAPTPTHLAPMPAPRGSVFSPIAAKPMQPATATAQAPIPRQLNVPSSQLALSPTVPSQRLAMLSPTAGGSFRPAVAGAIPMPQPPSSLSGVPTALPQVSTAKIGGSGMPAPGPQLLPMSSNRGGTGSQPVPVSVNTGSARGGGTDGPPQVVNAARQEGRGDSSGHSTAPLPVKSASAQAGAGGPSIAVGPVGKITPRSSSTDGDGVKSARDGEESSGAATVDFGKYMADLQKRIRKHWFPPRDPNSKVASVTFVITRSGNLQSLRILNSSGLAASDNAALQAVENAAPFPPLPEGAPPSVDIEFTFTYQVFSQDGARIRRF
jgi:TonB family protein